MTCMSVKLKLSMVLILAAVCVPVLSAAPAVSYAEGKTSIILGKTDAVAPKVEKQLAPIVNYLAARLGDMGITEGLLAIPKDGNQAVELIKQGKLDLAIASPFPTIKYRAEAGTTPILLGERHGMKEYSSMIFVRKDSGIASLEDLKGKIIAFEDATSTSEYFLPRYSIEKKGLQVVEVNSVNDPVPADKVGYIFAGDELNITSWVFHGKVAAGALSSALWGEQKANPEAYRREFEILFESLKVPRVIVSVRAGLDPKLVARIKEELLKMPDIPEGAAALDAYTINGFYDFPDGLLDPIQDMYDHFSGE